MYYNLKLNETNLLSENYKNGNSYILNIIILCIIPLQVQSKPFKKHLRNDYQLTINKIIDLLDQSPFNKFNRVKPTLSYSVKLLHPTKVNRY